MEPGKSVDIERGIWAGRTEAEVEVRPDKVATTSRPLQDDHARSSPPGALVRLLAVWSGVWSRRSGVPYGWRSRLREALLQTPAACLKVDRREDS